MDYPPARRHPEPVRPRHYYPPGSAKAIHLDVDAQLSQYRSLSAWRAAGRPSLISAPSTYRHLASLGTPPNDFPLLDHLHGLWRDPSPRDLAASKSGNGPSWVLRTPPKLVDSPSFGTTPQPAMTPVFLRPGRCPSPLPSGMTPTFDTDFKGLNKALRPLAASPSYEAPCDADCTDPFADSYQEPGVMGELRALEREALKEKPYRLRTPPARTGYTTLFGQLPPAPAQAEDPCIGDYSEFSDTPKPFGEMTCDTSGVEIGYPESQYTSGIFGPTRRDGDQEAPSFDSSISQDTNSASDWSSFSVGGVLGAIRGQQQQLLPTAVAPCSADDEAPSASESSAPWSSFSIGGVLGAIRGQRQPTAAARFSADEASGASDASARSGGSSQSAQNWEVFGSDSDSLDQRRAAAAGFRCKAPTPSTRRRTAQDSSASALSGSDSDSLEMRRAMAAGLRPQAPTPSNRRGAQDSSAASIPSASASSSGDNWKVIASGSGSGSRPSVVSTNGSLRIIRSGPNEGYLPSSPSSPSVSASSGAMRIIRSGPNAGYLPSSPSSPSQWSLHVPRKRPATAAVTPSSACIDITENTLVTPSSSGDASMSSIHSPSFGPHHCAVAGHDGGVDITDNTPVMPSFTESLLPSSVASHSAEDVMAVPPLKTYTDAQIKAHLHSLDQPLARAMLLAMAEEESQRAAPVVPSSPSASAVAPSAKCAPPLKQYTDAQFKAHLRSLGGPLAKAFLQVLTPEKKAPAAAPVVPLSASSASPKPVARRVVRIKVKSDRTSVFRATHKHAAKSPKTLMPGAWPADSEPEPQLTWKAGLAMAAAVAIGGLAAWWLA